jgi:cytochrome oxidase Cu insertion factor (SCO1/SenC/PrrC family)
MQSSCGVEGPALAGVRSPIRRLRLWVVFAAALFAVAGCAAAAPAAPAAPGLAAGNPGLDLGTPLGGRPAPDFRLVNQFGQPMSLGQFRGKAVILAFADSQCTTVCPLTTSAMAEAKDLLGAAGSRVQLLGVDANPQATSVADVRAYSRDHGLINRWDFLTGPPAQLERTWQAYHVAVQIQQGLIDHTPALFVIDPRGREQMLYLTALAYASIGQAAQVLAQEVSKLLPGHPRLARPGSLAQIPGVSPAARVTLPSATSGPARSVVLGPGRPHLVMFFATWLQETSSLGQRLQALGQYARAAARARLPQLAAVDETATEPSAGAVRAWLQRLKQPLGYPVALDTTGRLADGYGVGDQPWFVLVSASGQIIWHHDGWLSAAALLAAVRRG